MHDSEEGSVDDFCWDCNNGQERPPWAAEDNWRDPELEDISGGITTPFPPQKEDSVGTPGSTNEAATEVQTRSWEVVKAILKREYEKGTIDRWTYVLLGFSIGFKETDAVLTLVSLYTFREEVEAAIPREETLKLRSRGLRV
jgi:hypothetical protein